MDRRRFIRQSSLATAAVVTGVHSPLFAQNSSNLKIGLIGSGWYGMVIAKAALQAGGVEIVAICDVDTTHLKNSATELTTLQGSKPKEFRDYHELLNMPGLDAVLIGTPPHWHALQFIDVCKKGLPIYCEKPLAYDIDEGKAMMEAARKAENIIQIGFQRRQSNAFQKARELIQNGKIGRVRQIGAQIHYNPGNADTTVQDPPSSLDWDAWCGPAPKLPYRPSIGHGSWRLEKEYGNGHLVDWGIHHIDIIRTIMDFDMPESIYATGSLDVMKGRITTPDTLLATMHFKDCPVVWQHRLWGTGELNPQFNNGIFFYGEKGTLFASDDKLILTPTGRDKDQVVMDIDTPDMQEKHLAEFIHAVKAKDKRMVSCKVEDAFRSTASVQLAMIAYETGSEVKWDITRNTISDNDKAKKLSARPYRQGYKRPTY
ncbi:Gfo/Idh/MocA family oxidoreductase [Proteiniphilum sp.]|uniref:Gfo/Idh/MocA family protein n=1 Tax=Proteiniphilum sp. TaxID=1926877 RepID=UPI002B2127BC|nr:Gfo/Idh/MocA family oxidoreductase [Proteiniphilum sp.]MEA4916945.1 Gfo/Idh/MocA family oxidoreductase [Proteiniphilum sp.]